MSCLEDKLSLQGERRSDLEWIIGGAHDDSCIPFGDPGSFSVESKIMVDLEDGRQEILHNFPRNPKQTGGRGDLSFGVQQLLLLGDAQSGIIIVCEDLGGFVVGIIQNPFHHLEASYQVFCLLEALYGVIDKEAGDIVLANSLNLIVGGQHFWSCPKEHLCVFFGVDPIQGLLESGSGVG